MQWVLGYVGELGIGQWGGLVRVHRTMGFGMLVSGKSGYKSNVNTGFGLLLSSGVGCGRQQPPINND